MLISGAIAAALWNACFPSPGPHQRPGGSNYVAVAVKYLAILAWIGLGIGALGWACGRHVVQWIYGARYLQCGLYFEWLCLNIAICFVNYGVVAVLVPWGRSTHYFKITKLQPP